MMSNVDYLSRIHNSLVKNHVLFANSLVLSDWLSRPDAYEELVLVVMLAKCQYSMKKYRNVKCLTASHTCSITP